MPALQRKAGVGDTGAAVQFQRESPEVARSCDVDRQALLCRCHIGVSVSSSARAVSKLTTGIVVTLFHWIIPDWVTNLRT